MLWHNADGDGVRQPWEAPLSGVTVTLDGSQTAVTDEHGRYQFIRLSAGSHTLGAAIGIPAKEQSGTSLFLPVVMQ